MTTIHVSIDDHAEALGVIATLLNQGYQVSVDLDVVAFVEPDYMPNESLNSLVNQAQLQRVEADEAEIRRRLWGRESEAQANIDRAHIERERAETAMEAIERTHCPKCGAMPGKRCYTLSGTNYPRHKVHIDREMRLLEMRRDVAHPVEF